MQSLAEVVTRHVPRFCGRKDRYFILIIKIFVLKILRFVEIYLSNR
jgi:hypothetical protein